MRKASLFIFEISVSVGARTLTTICEELYSSSAVGTILAPAATYAASGIVEPAPAPA